MSQHPAQPRAGIPQVPQSNRTKFLAIEAEAAASASTPAAPRYAWHANGDLCGGEDCPVLDADGDHPAPTPAEPLDAERLDDLQALIRGGIDSDPYLDREGCTRAHAAADELFAYTRLAAARPEADHD